MNRAEFEARYEELLRGLAGQTDNVGCVACERCEGCRDSTFCADTKRAERSHYCVRCEDVSECSHCRDTRQCSSCVHCRACERCTGSAYLVRCSGCVSCTYCFGCVGLQRKDFHILNEPYDRKTYFAKVRELERALGLR